MNWSVPYNDYVIYIATIKCYMGCKGVVIGDVEVFPKSHCKVGVAGGKIFPHSCAIVLKIEDGIKFNG